MNPEALWQRLEQLDAELLRLLNERTRAAVELGQARPVETPWPETAGLERAPGWKAGPLPEPALRSIYREICSAAQALTQPRAVAFLGPAATFTHQAAHDRFGSSVRYLPCETISDVFAVVEKRTADYGVVPIENSTDGAVTHTLDQLAETPLKISAEIYLPISQCLVAAGPREQLRRLYSKPEAFGQCRRWLHENLPGVELASASSTARAAEIARDEPGSGALASSLAAELYGLRILEHDIQDLGGNTTRFLVIARAYGPPSGRDKTSILFAVRHKVGALHDALGAFKKYTVNMTRIESRPSKTKAWEYYFFVDLEGHAQEEQLRRALEDLAEHCTLLTVLGSYPRAGAEAS